MSQQIDNKGTTDQIEAAPYNAELDRTESLQEKKEDVVSHNIVAADNDMGLLQAIRVFPTATMYSVLGAMTAVSDGFQYNLPGNILALRGFKEQFGQTVDASGNAAMVSQHVSIWGAGYTLGYIFALWTGTYPSDRFGRKPMILSIHLINIVTVLIEMFATDWKHWLAAKILNGMSVGINQSALTTYVSELSPTPARGALLANYPIWWTIGSFLANVTLNIMSKRPTGEWRNAILSQWAFNGVGIIIWFFLPETPRWLCRRGRHEDARKSLYRINGKVKDYDLEREYDIIQQEVSEGKALSDAAKEVNFFTIFKRINLRRTFISFFPFAWQQWTGNPIISQYTAYFFDLAGLQDPFMGSLCVSVIKVASALISPIFTEKIGRRRLCLIGGCLMVPCMFSISGVLRVPDLRSNAGAGIALITICCIWMASYCTTLNTIGYVYLGETSTLLLRAKTTGFAAGSTGVLNFVHNAGLPEMLNAPGFGPSGSCFFYSCTCLGGLIVTYFFIPETKGRSYIELDELFERKVSARKFRTTVTKVDVAKQEARERGNV